MKIQRDVPGLQLVKALRALGYERIRQDGSHIRLTTRLDGEFHVTVPSHPSVRVGSLKAS